MQKSLNTDQKDKISASLTQYKLRLILPIFRTKVFQRFEMPS